MNNIDTYRLKDYATVFSRSVFSDAIKYGDCSKIKRLIETYESQPFRTFGEYVAYIYGLLLKGYRCEYVYKNELINKAIVNHLKKEDTVVYNEFKVGNSIADIALFNGESRAFEIKTEYDTTKRLNKQLGSYSKLFEKCYVVVPIELCSFYENYLSEDIGIISLAYNRGKATVKKYREAVRNTNIDPHILMGVLRTKEYMHIVELYYGSIPNVSCFEMYEICEKLICSIPSEQLNKFFIDIMKGRKPLINTLNEYPREIRQMCLSMNLKQKEMEVLGNILSTPIFD